MPEPQAGAEVADKDWDQPLRQPEQPVLEIDGFGGPLELLLDLAERQQVDLGRISVLALAEQFAAEQERLQPLVTLERRAEWVVVAARLLLLRSRLLLAGEGGEAAAAARRAVADEEERLRSMLGVRAAADWLAARPQLGRDTWARPHASPSRVASYFALMEACLAVLRGPDGQPGAGEAAYVPHLHGLFRISDAVARIRAMLEGKGKAEGEPESAETGPIAFERCLPLVDTEDPRRELKARSAVASSFVAVLELAREGELEAEQDEGFGGLSFRVGKHGRALDRSDQQNVKASDTRRS